MKALLAILCLCIAGCASLPKRGITITGSQLQASVERRHGVDIEPLDNEYRLTTLDEVWQANMRSWRPSRGEVQDCDDDCRDLIAELGRMGCIRGEYQGPAAVMLSAIMRDGRRHAIVEVLCETANGAKWQLWDASDRRQLGRDEVRRVFAARTY